MPFSHIPHPPFSPRDAFAFNGGEYRSIIEEDIEPKEQKPRIIKAIEYVNADDGTKIPRTFDKLLPMPTIPGHNAAFVRAIRKRFPKKADGILN